jgi:Dockerin type I domain
MRVAIEQLETRQLLSAITNWSSRGPGGGGAFFSPSFSPYNSSELYTVSDMSGLYHTTNLGQSWSVADFRQIQGGPASQVQFTSNPNILYTLDFSDNSSGGSSTAPTKSTDGGATWLQVPGWNGSDDQAFSLFANPASTTQLLVTDFGNLFFSNNGGQSFTQVFTDPTGQGCWVGGVFWSGNNIYVGTDAGLLISTNGGTSFGLSTATGLPSGASILSMAGAQQNGVTRLVCITANSGDVFNGLETGSIPDGSYSGTWTLTPGQSSWTPAASVPAADGPLIVSMALNDINDIYLGGTNYATSDPIIAKSTDGGQTFNDVLHTTSNGNIATGWQGAGGDRNWSFDQLTEGFEVDPANSNELAFTGFGFLHLSTNGGQTWQQAYVTPATQNPAGSNTPQHDAYQGIGLEDTSTLYLNWTSAQTINAGYTDIYGVRSTDGGQSWSFPTGISLSGNTVYCITQQSGILYAATSNTHDVYQSTHVTDSSLDSGTGNILFSTNSGATWSVLHTFGHPVVWVATDPNDPNRLYASAVSSTAGGIYTTDNLSAGTAATWTQVTAPSRTQGHPFNLDVLADGTLVATFSGRRVGNSFTNSSGVFISTDHGQTWTDRTGTGMQFWTKDITIDPTDPTQSTWYASVRFAFGTTGASGTGGLYRTTNRGQTWTQIFQSIGAESAAINPTTGEMYVSTEENSLYYSANPKAAAPTFTQTDYPFRQPERIFFNPYNSNEVWVTSFGYGLTVGETTTPLSISGNNAYVKLDADLQHIDVWNNATATGSPTQYLFSATFTVTYTGAAGNDNFVLDFSNGNPLPAASLTYTGGAGQNTLKLLGTIGSDNAVVNSSTITFSTTTFPTFGTVSITYTGATTILIDGDSTGTDVLTQTAQPASGATLTFLNTTAADTLNINSGTYTFPASTTSGISVDLLGTLSIGSNAMVALAPPTNHANRTVLVLNNLSIAGTTNAWTGRLDVSSNDMIVRGAGEAGYGTINNMTAQGRGPNGLWTGPGIASSSASITLGKYALGVIINDTNQTPTAALSGTPLYSTFDNQSVSDGDVLIKYTYAGDANLDGTVNASDYLQIDNNVNLRASALTGWFNGDFNYDGLINGDDYTLIDNAFNTQGSVLLSALPANQLAPGTPPHSKTQVAIATTPIAPPNDNTPDLKKRRHIFSDIFDAR